jgi:two-component system chemotaxis sensor kinase CheA
VLDSVGVDLLLRTTDVLTTLVRLATDGKPLRPDQNLAMALAAHLARMQGLEPAAPVDSSETLSPEPAATPPSTALVVSEPRGVTSDRWARFRVMIRVAKTCATPGVRAFLVHKKLSSIGQIFDTRPLMEDIRAGRLPRGEMALVLETRLGDSAIHKILAQVADLESVEVGPADEPLAVEPEALTRVVGNEPPRTIRVQTETLDQFLDSAGELLLATANLREVAKEIPDRYRPNLDEGIDRLHGIIKDLHDRVVRARMTPLALITDRLPRAVRDICRRTGREAELSITGAEIELDRAILDELADPVLHLLRNCLDHGLEGPAERLALGKPERGKVRVAARRDRDRVVLEIEDDGQGMDTGRLQAAAIERGLITAEQAQKLGRRELLMLACLPGVSTATNVSDLSGRGVGMDAVKRAVESVGGTLEIESDPGLGTRFTLRLPLTVAVINVLLVEVGEEIFGLPLTKVVSALELSTDELFTSQGAEMLSYGGQLLPVHRLSPLLGVPEGALTSLKPYLVVDGESSRVALQVDRLIGQEEVVLKPLTRPLDLVPGLSGVTILGSGRPIFILDVPRLI